MDNYKQKVMKYDLKQENKQKKMWFAINKKKVQMLMNYVIMQYTLCHNVFKNWKQFFARLLAQV